jgi:copper(I)-binding protein
MRNALALAFLAALAALAPPFAPWRSAQPSAEEASPENIGAGDLAIDAPWARATPGGATVGAGYLRITNGGAASDVLIGGSTLAGERIEIHEMTMTDGVMRMRALAQGLEIKPGETVELKPGGLHLMFIGLKSALKEGEAFKAKLEFRNAGAVEVEFSVAPIGAASAPHAH